MSSAHGVGRARRIGLALAAALAVALALPFAVRWSRGCEEERARARAAWARYAREAAGTAAGEDADRVLRALERGVTEAVEEADALPARARAPGYREAIEQLTLAHGACNER
ncbi:MAG: hypothetical protein KF729_19775 [Sandaracinaceae bacterium]|nr:hypothetical protein [Sandaracinaceae bacterium]